MTCMMSCVLIHFCIEVITIIRCHVNSYILDIAEIHRSLANNIIIIIIISILHCNLYIQSAFKNYIIKMFLRTDDDLIVL